LVSFVKAKKAKRPKPPPRPPATTTDDELISAEVTSGVGSGKGINQKLRNAFGVPYAFLTEEQWKEIQSKAGLRPSAKFELNIALRRYWLERLNALIDPKARTSVAETKQRLHEAYVSLATLMLDEEVFKGPVAYYQRTPLQQRKELQQTCNLISNAILTLSAAEKRLTRGRGQPSYGPLYDLIHHLDFILYASNGVCVTRSKNRIPAGAATDTPSEYIWTVLKVADLQVSKSTVDTVLRNYITDRDKHDRGFPERAI
jgi:hypothetical protein